MELIAYLSFRVGTRDGLAKTALRAALFLFESDTGDLATLHLRLGLPLVDFILQEFRQDQAKANDRK
jgi:hypothetical protein